MGLEFKRITEFNRGLLQRLLVNGYSFDTRWQACFGPDWQEFDDFFFDHPSIADKYGFITTMDGAPIGHISWDPRNMPEYVEIGHNCIASEHKGNGCGKLQLLEAIRRIRQYKGVKRLIVTTNAELVPARRNYEGAGFKIWRVRENVGEAAFSGDYIDYELVLQ